MAKLPLMICVLFVLSVLASASLAAEITASCPGSETVYLHVMFGEDELGDGWQGVVVEREIVGECGTGTILTEEPLQIPDDLDVGVFDLEFDVPLSSLAYRYSLMGLDAEGNLVDMTGSDYSPTWFVVEACIDDALMMRGTLYDIGEFATVGINLCPDDCWSICTLAPTVGVIDLDPADYQPLLGTETVVNVYGLWDSLPPDVSWGCMNAARLEVVEDCSGTVSAEQSSWGALKDIYR